MKKARPYASLKAWRLSLGLSQRAAAELLGVRQGLYGKYELRQVSPRPERAVAISEKTRVPFEVLMRVA